MNVIKRLCFQTFVRQLRTSSSVHVYKSSLSIDKIYPNSNHTPRTQNEIPVDPKCPNFSGYIPLDKVQITYSRSSGPGGQNVNTVSTKVDLRFHVATADWLSDDIRKRIAEQRKTMITKDGFLVIRSDKTRLQLLNQADCMERLRTLIRSAAEPPKIASPESEEKLRKRREKNARLRLLEKRERSYTKQQRQAPALD